MQEIINAYKQIEARISKLEKAAAAYKIEIDKLKQRNSHLEQLAYELSENINRAETEHGDVITFYDGFYEFVNANHAYFRSMAESDKPGKWTPAHIRAEAIYDRFLMSFSDHTRKHGNTRQGWDLALAETMQDLSTEEAEHLTEQLGQNQLELKRVARRHKGSNLCSIFEWTKDYPVPDLEIVQDDHGLIEDYPAPLTSHDREPGEDVRLTSEKNRYNY